MQASLVVRLVFVIAMIGRLDGVAHGQIGTLNVGVDGPHATVLVNNMGPVQAYNFGKTVNAWFQLQEMNGVGASFDTFDFTFTNPVTNEHLGTECHGCGIPNGPIYVGPHATVRVTLPIYQDRSVISQIPDWWMQRFAHSRPNFPVPGHIVFHGKDDRGNPTTAVGFPPFTFTSRDNIQITGLASFATADGEGRDTPPSGWTPAVPGERFTTTSAVAVQRCPENNRCIGYLRFSTTIRVALPGQGGTPVAFGEPPLPDLQKLTDCRSSSVDGTSFYQCVVNQALPPSYRISLNCYMQNQADPGRAFACSTQNERVLTAYDKVQSLRRCQSQSSSNAFIANCVGPQFVGPNEQYYISCITKNSSSFGAAAVCALSKNLTPEQQIALSCAIETGGQPYAFAACTGGQLLSRELDKCWQYGIATDGGCFGPNNEYVKFLSAQDAEFRNVFGDHSVVYEAYNLWKNNVLAPGPSNDVIRNVNNSLSDLRNGPGQNNDLVRLGNKLSGAFKSIGLGF